MHAARLEFEKNRPATDDDSVSYRAGKSPVVHVGCSGWYYWHWKFSLYEGVASKDWFRTYASHFDTVELNAPFYAWPTTKTVQTWVRQVAEFPNFKYTVKVSELITHVKRFVGTKTLVRDFSHIGDLLGDRMGAFLYQLPPSYTYTPGRLRAIATQLEGLSERHTNVVEFRHKSWWNPTVYRVFKEANLTFCSSSGPRMPDELVTTNRTLYLRFHGTKQWYLHNYTAEELKVWLDRIAATKATTVYAYFNNDREGHAHQNAEFFVQMFKSQLLASKQPKRPGSKRSSPAMLTATSATSKLLKPLRSVFSATA